LAERANLLSGETPETRDGVRSDAIISKATFLGGLRIALRGGEVPDQPCRGEEGGYLVASRGMAEVQS